MKHNFNENSSMQNLWEKIKYEKQQQSNNKFKKVYVQKTGSFHSLGNDVINEQEEEERQITLEESKEENLPPT